jgi:carbamoyl-phosphate synthase large subunit
METKTVLVTGIGGNVGQGVLRNIRNSFNDLRIIGVDIVGFTAGNHLCDKTYQVPYSNDDLYIPEIKKIINKENVKLIIPTTDYEVYFLALHKSNLNTILAANDAAIAKVYLDKYQTYLHHKKNGIPFAETWLPEEYKCLKGEIIAKPREGRGSRGLIYNPPSPQNLTNKYVVQPLLIGKEITTAAYVTKQDKLHGVFTMERELVNGATSKSRVVFDYDTDLKTIINRMVEAGRLRGSFNVQSIVTNQGEIIPFEVNCRISGTNSIRHNLGFKDVKYTLQECIYNQYPDEPKPISGVATRILHDVIYPEATQEQQLNSRFSKHILY